MRAAIFDFDGTLFDSMYVWENFAKMFLSRVGAPEKPEAEERVRYMCLIETAEYFISECGVSGTVEEVMAECNRMLEEEYFYKVQTREGIPQLLSYLFEENVPVYIATATERYLVEAAIKRTGIDKYINGILTCNDVGEGKTKPTVFLRAAELMGSTPQETWVFEDALHAVTSASGAGFKVCAVYDSAESDHIDEIRSLSDIYVENFTQLDYGQLH
ncbi:MAG: HAD family phosphatase [Clostridia bacterium]|nr:HAD family phosphatase [Clostridia bacterium]